jgi:hypothetical protein
MLTAMLLVIANCCNWVASVDDLRRVCRELPCACVSMTCLNELSGTSPRQQRRCCNRDSNHNAEGLPTRWQLHFSCCLMWLAIVQMGSRDDTIGALMGDCHASGRTLVTSVVLPHAPCGEAPHMCWGHCCTASNLCVAGSPLSWMRHGLSHTPRARAAPATQPRRCPNAIGWMACLASRSTKPLAASVAGWP